MLVTEVSCPLAVLGARAVELVPQQLFWRPVGSLGQTEPVVTTRQLPSQSRQPIHAWRTSYVASQGLSKPLLAGGSVLRWLAIPLPNVLVTVGSLSISVG